MLGRYRIDRRLGEGGEGTVYAAVDRVTGVSVAVKLMLPAAGLGAEDLASLRREVSTLSSLAHPRLARVLEFGMVHRGQLVFDRSVNRDGYYLVRTRAEGEDLAAYARRRRPAVPSASGPWVAQLCAVAADALLGLGALHRAGLRHGDVKPTNFIVADDGAVSVIDFGFSVGETAPVVGATRSYAAPELVRGGLIDRRADLYAMGVTLIELFSGSCPAHPPLDPVELTQWIDAALGEISSEALRGALARLLAADPEARFPRAEEAAAALSAVAERGGAALRRQAEPMVPPAKLPAAAALLALLEPHLRGTARDDVDPLLVALQGAPGSGRSTVATDVAWELSVAGVEPLWVHAFGDRSITGALANELDDEAEAVFASHADALGVVAEALVTRAQQRPQLVILDGPGDSEAKIAAAVRRLAALVAGRGIFAFVLVTDDVAVEALADFIAVRVAPLDRAEVARLIAATLDEQDDGDDTWADALHARTGGNLRLVREGLRRLALGEPRAPGALNLPADLTAYEALAISRCSPDGLAVLRTLSLWGGSAAAWQLELALGTASPSAAATVLSRRRRAVAELEACGLITHSGSARWRLARTFTARVVTSEWAVAERQALAAALLSALPGAWRGAAASGERAAVATERGAPPARNAVAIAAAELALDVGDRDAVSRWIDEAVGALVGEGERLRCGALAQQAAVLLFGPGWSRDAVKDAAGWMTAAAEAARLSAELVTALALASPVVDALGEQPSASAEARLVLARASDEAGETTRASGLLDALIAGDADGKLRATAARERSRLAIKQGRYDEAVAVAEAGLRALAATAGDDRRRGAVVGGEPALGAELECALAFARGMAGDASCEARLWSIAQAAGEAGHHERLAVAETYRAILAFRRGDYPTARTGYEHALAAALRGGDVVRAGTTRMNLATLAFHGGAYGAARSHHARAARLLRAAASRSAEAVARKNLGQVLLEIGESEEGLAELARSRACARGLSLTLHDAGLDALEAIARVRAGDPGGFDLLRVALAAFDDAADHRRVADTLLDWIELRVERDERAEPGADLGERELPAQSLPSLLQRYDALGAVTEDVLRRARRVVLGARVSAAAGSAVGFASVDEALALAREKEAIHLLAQLELHAAHAASAAAELDRAAVYAASARRTLEQIAASLDGERARLFWRDPRRRSLLQVAQRSDTQLSARDGADPRLWEVLEIYRRMATETDPDRLVEIAMDTALSLTGAERGFLLLEAQGALRLSTASMRNLPPATVAALHEGTGGQGEPTALYSKTIAERVFRTGEPMVSNAPRFDPRLDHARSVHVLSLESVICLPIFARGRIAGVLYVESHARRREFGAAELRLLGALCDQMAVLLGNARLLAENRERTLSLTAANARIELLLAEQGSALAQTSEELSRTQGHLASVRRRMLGEPGAYGIIGRSAPIERVFELIDRLAPTDVSVLIRGESGTGKELVARALHDRSPRRKQPLHAVNCGALPESLLESELFGHERGAFTGAERRRRGLFEAADGGTLFLDEVGETPPRMQAALLRVLQDGVVRRVGGERDHAVDVRLLCATHRSLEKMVEAGTFREDLFYRLNVVPIDLPPLRDRLDDLPLLVAFFCQRIAAQHGLPKPSLSSAALRVLREQAWPGNVRQLEHVLTAVTIMSEGKVIAAAEVEAVCGGPGGPKAGIAGAADPRALSPEARRQAERAEILEALRRANWNKAKAARLLQIPRRTFYRRLADYDIA